MQIFKGNMATSQGTNVCSMEVNDISRINDQNDNKRNNLEGNFLKKNEKIDTQEIIVMNNRISRKIEEFESHIEEASGSNIHSSYIDDDDEVEKMLLQSTPKLDVKINPSYKPNDSYKQREICDIHRSNRFQRKMMKESINSNNFSDESDICLLYTSPSPRDGLLSRMPSSA